MALIKELKVQTTNLLLHPFKYLGLIKVKTQNAVPPAKRAAQHFGF